MKKLSAEEAKNVHPVGKGKFTWLYKELIQLAVNEAIIINNQDWKTKTGPYPTIKRAAKNTHFQFEYGRMPDGSGWIVKRVG